MNLKKILTAAAAAITLTVGLAGTADAAPFGRFDRHNDRHDRRVERVERRVVEHRVIFSTLRARHIRYVGTPYFVRGHYVVKSFDRRGRVTFVEVNPYTGGYVGFIRL